MRRPPLVARVRFNGHSVGLWVPLFLVWLLLLVLLLPLLILLIVVALFAPRRWRIGPLAAGAWRVLCETRGTEVELAGARSGVEIVIL